MPTNQLVNLRGGNASGGFACHVDVDPWEEVDRILRISGSPYEEDSGSRMNDDHTFIQGVHVINRYDWGYYSAPFYQEIGEGALEDERDDILANSNSCGIVDRAHARAQVDDWKTDKPSMRRASEAGIWMYVPGGEYMFGRFGMNGARDVAQPFFFLLSQDFLHALEFQGSPRQGCSSQARVIIREI